jgi:hypothetical protein
MAFSVPSSGLKEGITSTENSVYSTVELFDRILLMDFCTSCFCVQQNLCNGVLNCKKCCVHGVALCCTLEPVEIDTENFFLQSKSNLLVLHENVHPVFML